MAKSTPNTQISTSGSDLVRPDGRPAAVVLFETHVVAYFVAVAELLSIPKSVAAIYGIVFASAEPLSFAEIEARLDISKGSISGGLRALKQVGALKDVSGDDDRSERYEPDLELRQLLHRFLESRVQKELSEGATRISKLKSAAVALPASPRKILGLRVGKLQRWNDRTRALLPLIKTFLNLAG